jgi:hypothetical protein
VEAAGLRPRPVSAALDLSVPGVTQMLGRMRPRAVSARGDQTPPGGDRAAFPRRGSALERRIPVDAAAEESDE